MIKSTKTQTPCRLGSLCVTSDDRVRSDKSQAHALSSDRFYLNNTGQLNWLRCFSAALSIMLSADFIIKVLRELLVRQIAGQFVTGHSAFNVFDSSVDCLLERAQQTPIMPPRETASSKLKLTKSMNSSIIIFSLSKECFVNSIDSRLWQRWRNTGRKMTCCHSIYSVSGLTGTTSLLIGRTTLADCNSIVWWSSFILSL